MAGLSPELEERLHELDKELEVRNLHLTWRLTQSD
jgi:hypothetical protein